MEDKVKELETKLVSAEAEKVNLSQVSSDDFFRSVS